MAENMLVKQKAA